MNDIFKYLKKEALRILPLLLVAGLILVPDSSGSFVILYSIGITIVISAVSHLIRKILFPYVNLRDYAQRALETPASAAIVFFSISMILSVIIVASCVLLH